MVWTAIMAAGALLLSSQLIGEATPPAESTPLWLDMNAGETPEVVAEKVRAIPGVKRAQVKRNRHGPNLAISYTGDGIEISGEVFKAYPRFDAGGLTGVDLIAGERCAVDGADRYRALFELLRIKYPDVLTNPAGPTPSEFAEAVQLSGAVSSALTNGKTVVLLTQSYTGIEAPQNGYATGPIANFARHHLWSQYQNRASECAGTGLIRSSITIQYMTVADFTRRTQERRQELETGKANDLDKL
jgi:hypothetical protein